MTFDNVNRAIGERNLPKSVLRAQSYSFAYYSSSALEALTTQNATFKNRLFDGKRATKATSPGLSTETLV